MLGFKLPNNSAIILIMHFLPDKITSMNIHALLQTHAIVRLRLEAKLSKMNPEVEEDCEDDYQSKETSSPTAWSSSVVIRRAHSLVPFSKLRPVSSTERL